MTKREGKVKTHQRGKQTQSLIPTFSAGKTYPAEGGGKSFEKRETKASKNT